MALALQPKLPSLPQAPQFNGPFDHDLRAMQSYLAQAANIGPEQRPAIREIKEAFFRRHAAAIYDAVTGNCSKALRVNEVVYSAAERFPGLLPTRAQIETERALKVGAPNCVRSHRK